MAPIDPSTDPAKEAYNHGMALDPENRRVQCCYCGKVVSGFNRLQHHLGGIRGNIVECLDVSSDVRDFFRESLLSAKVGRLVKEVGDLSHPGPPMKRSCTTNGKTNGVNQQKNVDARNDQPKGQKSLLGDAMGRISSREPTSNQNGCLDSQGACSGKAWQDSASITAKRCIGRFFFENNVDFNAVMSQSFQRMMEIYLRSGDMRCSIPTRVELKGWILDDELYEMQNYVKEIRCSWRRTGCSVLLDGWIDHLGRSLVNIIVNCPEGPIYLRSADITPATKGANALQLLLEAVLEEVGVQNVVQIIVHTSSESIEAVGKQLIEKHRSLFWTVSATHCISLMLDKISRADSIRLTLDKAMSITKFIYSRAGVLKLLRRHIHSHDLVRSSKIKAASPFLTLENLLVEKTNLDRMFTSPEWLNCSWASTVEGEIVANMISDSSFWGGVIIAVKASIPLVRALSLINGDGEPHMGFIYETMDQVKETISEEFGGKKSQYMPFWKIIDEIWNTILHSPLHAAGYFLNPRLYYTEAFYSDTEVAGGLLITIVRMVEDQRTQDLISRQIDVYGGCKGDFKLGTEKNNEHTLSLAAWWSRFGGHCPDLQRLAVKILSQTCNGAEFYSLRRDLTEKLLSHGRNLVEQQQLRNLTYIHYNLQLKRFKMGAKFNIIDDEVDPKDEWIVDESYKPEVAESENSERAWVDTDCVSTSLSKSTIEEEGPSGVQPKIEPKC